MKGKFYKGNDRFEDKTMPITETGCWIWMASISPSGYGKFTTDVDHKTISAHRYSYLMYNGEIPKGLCVCHTCDIRDCVNPSHLFLGTHKDNSDDMISKGRSRHFSGEDNHSKLSEYEVISIREEYSSSSTTHRELARKYNVSHRTIGTILRREKWKHI